MSVRKMFQKLQRSDKSCIKSDESVADGIKFFLAAFRKIKVDNIRKTIRKCMTQTQIDNNCDEVKEKQDEVIKSLYYFLVCAKEEGLLDD